MDEWDAYFWPGSDVLRNIPEFKTEEELRRFEYAATRQRSEELALKPLPGDFDTAHFRAIHRHLFQVVYEWAGEYRTGAEYGLRFAPDFRTQIIEYSLKYNSTDVATTDRPARTAQRIRRAIGG